MKKIQGYNPPPDDDSKAIRKITPSKPIIEKEDAAIDFLIGLCLQPDDVFERIEKRMQEQEKGLGR